jgi:ClpP class serine protease
MIRRPFTRPGHLAIEPLAWGLGFMPFDPPKAHLFETVGDAAIVSISGPLTQHNEWSWWACDNYDDIKARVSAALESQATSLILRIDSPGGDAAGNFELARWIRESANAAGKTVYAHTDGVAASAAYAIACAADGGIYLTPSARVGSVGTIMVSQEQTGMDQQFGLRFTVFTSGAHKADGHPHVVMTDAAASEFQSQIDVFAGMFFEHVATMRGGALTVESVKGLEARMFIGATAVAIGLANGVKSFDELLAMVASGGAETELSGAKEAEENMSFEEMLAALKEQAEGDGDDAKKAQKMLKALESDDAKSEGDDADKGDEKKDEKKSDETGAEETESEDEDKDTQAAAPVATIEALSTQVQKLSSELGTLKGASDEKTRKDLIAKAPTLAKELQDVILKKNKAGNFVTPMSTVKAIVKAAPEAKKASNHAATLTTKPTPGAGQGGNIIGGVTRASSQADELDVRFGLKTEKGGISREGSSMVFKTMTADEARAAQAAKSAQAATTTKAEKQ